MAQRFFMLRAATAALTASLANTAMAQETAMEEASIQDVIVVTGARLQNQQAVEQKRNADTISDFITADDVGALPDFSVAEAVNRIVGVSTEGRNGDAEFVVIRGLRSDFNYLAIDGGIVPSTRVNGRATQLSVIPSYVIKSTEVVKSFTADLDGNAIGGQVLVSTRSAFDQNDTYLAARGALGYFDHNDGPVDLEQSSRADFAYATQFGANDQFGFVVSGSYSNQDYGTWLPGVGFNEYRFLTETGTLTNLLENAPAGAIRVPAGVQMYQYTNQIERLGGFAKLEWKPSDDLYLAVSAYQFEEEDTEQRWDTGYYPTNPNNLPTNLTETSGTLAQGIAQRQYFLQGDTNTLRSLSLTGSWNPDEASTVDFLITKADGERENPFYQVRFEAQGTANRSAFGYSYDSSGTYPVLTLTNPGAWEEDDRFTPVFHRPRFDINEQDAFQAKVDYARGMEDDGFGFKTGLSFRSDERFQDQLQDNDFRPNSDATRGYSFGNVRDDVTTGFDPELLGGLPQILIDPAAFLAYFDSTSGEWRDANNPDVEALSSQFQVKEDIAAGYLMGQYRAPNFVVNGGLRYEQTDVTSTGARRLTDSDPNTPEYPIVTETADYGKWLPSASLTWDLTNDFRARAAYSRSLGRGEYSQINVLGSQTIDDAMQTISITSGNPALAPRESDNFDLSLEYYFPNIDGAFAFGVFHKEIDNEIFTRSVQSEQVIGGVTYTVTDRRPANANSATLTGFEVGLTINSLDFISPVLEDVGFTANYANIDSSFEIEMANGDLRELFGLIRQPKDIANVSAFWAPGDFEFRAAWRYTGEHLESANASSPTFDEFIGEESRVDLQARYALPSGFTAFAEARNVTDNAEDQLLSYGPVHWTRDYGRSAWVGLIYKY